MTSPREPGGERLRLLRYLLLPKGAGAVIGKLWIYAPGACVLAASPYGGWRASALALAGGAALELLFGTARRMLNDVHDYDADARRGARWTPAFPRELRRHVVIVALAKVAAGTVGLALVRPALAVVGLALVGLQLTYDHYARSARPGLGVLVIATSYGVRALAPFAGQLDIRVPLGALLAVGAAAVLYGVVVVHEWRRAESEYIAGRELERKPGASYFLSPRAPRNAAVAWILLAAVAAAFVASCVDGRAVTVVASGCGAVALAVLAGHPRPWSRLVVHPIVVGSVVAVALTQRTPLWSVAAAIVLAGSAAARQRSAATSVRYFDVSIARRVGVTAREPG